MSFYLGTKFDPPNGSEDTLPGWVMVNLCEKHTKNALTNCVLKSFCTFRRSLRVRQEERIFSFNLGRKISVLKIVEFSEFWFHFGLHYFETRLYLKTIQWVSKNSESLISDFLEKLMNLII